jgi:hypothetical protein
MPMDHLQHTEPLAQTAQLESEPIGQEDSKIEKKLEKDKSTGKKGTEEMSVKETEEKNDHDKHGKLKLVMEEGVSVSVNKTKISETKEIKDKPADIRNKETKADEKQPAAAEGTREREGEIVGEREEEIVGEIAGTDVKKSEGDAESVLMSFIAHFLSNGEKCFFCGKWGENGTGKGERKGDLSINHNSQLRCGSGDPFALNKWAQIIAIPTGPIKGLFLEMS